MEWSTSARWTTICMRSMPAPAPGSGNSQREGLSNPHRRRALALSFHGVWRPSGAHEVRARSGLHPAEVQLDDDREAGPGRGLPGFPRGLVVADRQRVELAAEVDERHLLAKADLLDPAEQHQ